MGTLHDNTSFEEKKTNREQFFGINICIVSINTNISSYSMFICLDISINEGIPTL